MHALVADSRPACCSWYWPPQIVTTGLMVLVISVVSWQPGLGHAVAVPMGRRERVQPACGQCAWPCDFYVSTVVTNYAASPCAGCHPVWPGPHCGALLVVNACRLGIMRSPCCCNKPPLAVPLCAASSLLLLNSPHLLVPSTAACIDYTPQPRASPRLPRLFPWPRLCRLSSSWLCGWHAPASLVGWGQAGPGVHGFSGSPVASEMVGHRRTQCPGQPPWPA